MAIKSKDVLKTYFENGDKPNESQFSDLIDSLLHVDEEGSTGSGSGGGSTGGSTAAIKMPIPYVDSYDSFYFVSEENGDDESGSANSYNFYKSIVAASEAARLSYDRTGSKSIVYVFKGTYNEESINREHVDMYFEDGAVVWTEGTDSSVINDKLEPIVNANIYGKGTFVNKEYDPFDDREGINMRQASSMYIEAKLIDGAQLYLDDAIHFDFANMDVLFKISNHRNKSMKFTNCRFLTGLQISTFRGEGNLQIYDNCEFVLPEFSSGDPRNKDLDILDYNEELIFRIEPNGFNRGEEEDNNLAHIDVTNKTNDQILEEFVVNYVNNSRGVFAEVACIRFSELERDDFNLGDFKLEIRNSKCIIKKENCFGVILSKYKDSIVKTEGHVILDNIIVLDETKTKDTTALVTGWGALATQQPELLINNLSHNCATRQKLLTEGFNEWKITFDTISNSVPKTGGTFEGIIKANEVFVGEEKAATQSWVKNSIKENDYYNPNFEIPVSISNDDINTFDNTKHDFVFNCKPKWISTQIIDGFHCIGHGFSNTNLNRVEPYFSRLFLQNLKYDTGNYMRVGMWIKVTDADAENTRRLYFDTSVSTVFIVDNSNWNWYEIPNDVEITDDNFIGFTLGIRDQVNGGRWYMRGLTILNVSKEEWVGELNNFELQRQRTIPIVNENPYSRYIHENTLAYSGIYDQLQGDFTKSILKDELVITERADVIQTIGADAARSRINFPIINTSQNSDWQPAPMLLNQNSNNIVIKIGAYVKVDADADKFVVRIQNDSIRQDSTYRNLWGEEDNFGEWKWYESLPMNIADDDLKILDNILLQVDCTPNSGNAKIHLAGLTVTANNNPLSFRPQISKNLASEGRFYNKLWCSYGDSITVSSGWQAVANRYLGTQHINRGIGGATIANTAQMAYVDAKGNAYVDRNNAPTVGVEGVDWFKINSSLCTDERIATLPVDANLISLLGGVNDFGQNIPLGNIADVASDELGATFYASAKSIAQKIQSRCPNAFIINMTTPFRKNEELDEENSLNKIGLRVDDYRKALTEVFKLYGLQVIDSKCLGVNSANHSNYSNDGMHPNRQYEKMLGGLFASNVPSHRQYDYVKFS